MKELKNRNRFASEMIESDEDITIEELEEQLSDELEADDVDMTEIANLEADELVKEAEELLNNLEAEEDEVEAEEEDEVSEIIKACKELEAKIKSMEAEDEIEAEEEPVVEANEEVVEANETELPDDKEIVASETVPGIEDEIGDEANGGDPSVSEVVDNNVEVSTDKEVFPTNSEYVVANITKRLDRVATILEKRGMKRMALRVDQLSDKLELSIRK